MNKNNKYICINDEYNSMVPHSKVCLYLSLFTPHLLQCRVYIYGTNRSAIKLWNISAINLVMHAIASCAMQCALILPSGGTCEGVCIFLAVVNPKSLFWIPYPKCIECIPYSIPSGRMYPMHSTYSVASESAYRMHFIFRGIWMWSARRDSARLHQQTAAGRRQGSRELQSWAKIRWRVWKYCKSLC